MTKSVASMKPELSRELEVNLKSTEKYCITESRVVCQSFHANVASVAEEVVFETFPTKVMYVAYEM